MSIYRVLEDTEQYTGEAKAAQSAPPFHTKPCPKCETYSVTFKYLAVALDDQIVEWLRATCARCGFVWLMQPADAPKTAVRSEIQKMAEDFARDLR